MSAHLLVELKIKKPESYQKFADAIPEVIEQYGGRYSIRSESVTKIAGDWTPDKIILITFDSLDALRTCLTSPEYNAIAPFREEGADSKAYAIES